MAADTEVSAAVKAWPWYRACAATSPEWLTLIRRAASARSASASAAGWGLSGSAREDREGVAKTLIALSISPKIKSIELKRRVPMITLYYRCARGGAGLASRRRVLYTFAPFVNDLKQLS